MYDSDGRVLSASWQRLLSLVIQTFSVEKQRQQQLVRRNRRPLFQASQSELAWGCCYGSAGWERSDKWVCKTALWRDKINSLHTRPMSDRKLVDSSQLSYFYFLDSATPKAVWFFRYPPYSWFIVIISLFWGWLLQKIIKIKYCNVKRRHSRLFMSDGAVGC